MTSPFKRARRDLPGAVEAPHWRAQSGQRLGLQLGRKLDATINISELGQGAEAANNILVLEALLSSEGEAHAR
eukprot:CAMPEP_0206274442 /NCGR_PEP_ID=MMETSP0047_2-20121206/35156_1 /ASSEMBLY_ACC=CAM_ASM_000192 /TAXON_ID=195065 /ORGANISM="Chroomonas mesostigmatica_cf, Strain CCMP1168" /LENGTH=72 /DNA_ID=CAMNT_0053703655 /DNA_START=9 /DNA_END=224 /DNA_ORIENTATION=-